MPLHNQADHRFAQANLSAYLDGELSPAEAQRVRQHVMACAECQQELVALRATIALLQRAPVKALPRSFVLPPTAQPEQARHRRWNATYAFMRGGMVAVAAMLILTIGADVVFRTGIIPLPAASAPVVGAPDDAYGGPSAEVIETVVVQAVVEKQVEGVGGGESVAEATSLSEGEGMMALAAPTAEGSLAEDSTAGMLATEAAPAPEAPAQKSAPPAQTDTGPTGETVTAVAEAVQPEATSATLQPRAAAPTGPTAEPLATAAQVARGAEPTLAPGEPPAAKLAPGWIAWQVARTLLGILVGLLLILAAGLLWSGQKRRL